MGRCDPGHEWRPERETVNFLSFRCTNCGSVCVAPKSVDSVRLDRRRPASHQTPTAGPRRADVPRSASVGTASSTTSR